jgi:trk system potassium uptake protein TrkH
MNYKLVLNILGKLLMIEALGLLLPLGVAVYYKEESMVAFIITICITFLTGFLLSKIKIEKVKIKIKEGMAIVTFGWLFASLFGSLPFIISQSIPSFINAFFETVSGFTTTGATILDDIEVLPRGILFWRSFTHWIGGMGILVVAVAVLSAMGAGGFHVFRAESPGPVSDRIAPKIKDTAKILYTTYFIISLIELILLFSGGMSLYESAIHTFGTMGTGGFSSLNASIGGYSSTYIRIVITIFMVLAGANFSLYYAGFKGRWKEIYKNSELRLYLGIIFTCIVLITLNLHFSMYHNLGKALSDSSFQVGSIITTTGYTTTDFDKWPTFSKAMLFALMFVGGSSGSTGGSIKIIRILTLIKLLKREFRKIFHPRAVMAVKIDNEPVKSDVLSNISSFFILYLLIFIIGTILVSLEGIGLVGSAASVAATLGNIGPGFGFVGPTNTYSGFADATKILLSVFMLLGRLELFTVIAIFTPGFWKNEM